jgi:UrcA family protein
MEKNTRKSNLPAIAFALAALASTVPSSAIAGGPTTEKVPYGDLNLASEDGVKALDRRLDRAVERVCGEPQVRNLALQRRIEQCRADTWQSIQGERQFAIARATGQHDAQRAEHAFNVRSRVSLAE